MSTVPKRPITFWLLGDIRLDGGLIFIKWLAIVLQSLPLQIHLTWAIVTCRHAVGETWKKSYQPWRISLIANVDPTSKPMKGKPNFRCLFVENGLSMLESRLRILLSKDMTHYYFKRLMDVIMTASVMSWNHRIERSETFPIFVYTSDL